MKHVFQILMHNNGEVEIEEEFKGSSFRLMPKQKVPDCYPQWVHDAVAHHRERLKAQGHE